jgi:hypothetical protein
MKTPLLILSACLTGALSTTALAAPQSSTSEFRGYNACLDAEADRFEKLMPTRTYYLNDDGANRTYYINAKALVDGAWTTVGISCDTSRNGREVLSSRTVDSRFAAIAPSADVQVAGQ